MDKIAKERVWLDAYNAAMTGLLAGSVSPMREHVSQIRDEAQKHADVALERFIRMFGHRD